MPRTTQYIKEEDMEQWNKIENKSQWIHDHLNESKVKKTIEAISAPTPTHKTSKPPQPVKLDKSPTYKNTNNWGA